MASNRQVAPAALDDTSWLLVGALFTAALGGGALWAGASVSAVIIGGSPPHHDVLGHLSQLAARPGSPARAWSQRMPAPWFYWSITGLVLVLTVGLLMGIRHLSARSVARAHGAAFATRTEIRRYASAQALQRRAGILRPALAEPTASQLGYRLGYHAGRAVWTSVEDSVVLLGPPRSGKGRHFVIPMINAAPGAVLTTSTRPDNIQATLETRRHHGPVAIFDPQRLARNESARIRWSLSRGCAVPQTAMIRARALAAGTSSGAENGDFWRAQTEAALRSLLHAAALDGRSTADLYRWSLSPALAAEAVRILGSPGSAIGWAETLEEAINSDPRTRDSIWLGVRTALACLGDPTVLDAVSPAEDLQLDPESFLTDSGTVYLLGTSAGAGSASNLIAAFVEDVSETARQLAADSSGGRLEPPLALILDEVANYPLPSLPTLMSEGGGSGITTVAVFQSLAQARSRWGADQGQALWDSASVKVILGGLSNARDLSDLSALIGDRNEPTISRSRNEQGKTGTTTSDRRTRLLSTSDLYALPSGTAIALLRSMSPVHLRLR